MRSNRAGQWGPSGLREAHSVPVEGDSNERRSGSTETMNDLKEAN